ncbi:MAG: carbohydrate kinase family protein [Patescibacteria group bacterium]
MAQDNEFDFIGIGDVVTDAFVDLDSVSIFDRDVVLPNTSGSDLMCMAYGDKIPFNWHKVIAGVGNAANASVAATRLGLRTAYVSNVGDDEYGKGQIKALEDNGVDMRFVSTHPGEQSNYHYVILHKADRTILVKHTEYDYAMPDIGTPRWIYLSSLAENSLPHQLEIAQYVQSHPGIEMAFQPGTFQMKLGIEKLKSVYEASTLFFCNVEEAKRILYAYFDGLESEVENIEKEDGRAQAVVTLLERMHEVGPKIPVITDGPLGAYARDTDGAVYYCPMYPDPKPPIDRTGAGDSFSSTFTAIYAESGSVKEALLIGPINSMNVVQFVGAQEGLQDRATIDGHLKNAPDYYKISKIN